jgi:hypothetical protein
MDRIVQITVIGRSISSRSKGMNNPYLTGGRADKAGYSSENE